MGHFPLEILVLTTKMRESIYIDRQLGLFLVLSYLERTTAFHSNCHIRLYTTPRTVWHSCQHPSLLLRPNHLPGKNGFYKRCGAALAKTDDVNESPWTQAGAAELEGRQVN